MEIARRDALLLVLRLSRRNIWLKVIVRGDNTVGGNIVREGNTRKYS